MHPPARLMDSTLLRRNEAFQHHALERTSVLAHAGEQSYFAVNQVGARIWSLLEKPRTVGEVVQSLMHEFAVDETTCRQHTEAFLRQLLAQKLIIYER